MEHEIVSHSQCDGAIYYFGLAKAPVLSDKHDWWLGKAIFDDPVASFFRCEKCKQFFENLEDFELERID